MIYLNILLIAVIVVCIIDLSGFVENFKSALSKLLTKGKISNSNYTLRPFDCSLCTSFWLGLIYLIIYNSVSLLNITVLLLISISTPLIQDLIRLILDLITKLINYIYRKINNDNK